MRSKQIKILVLCAILAALSVVMLSIGCFIEVLDLTSAMLASLLIVIAVIEGGKVRATLTYFVTALLGFILLPVKLPALIYALAGYYPIIKALIEKIKSRVLGTALKILFFDLMLTLFLLTVRMFVPTFVLFPELDLGKILPYVIVYVVGNLTFVLYDILLTRAIALYLFRLRHKLGLDKHR